MLEAWPALTDDFQGKASCPVDLSNAWKGGAKIINSAISLLPNLILGIVVFIAFLLIGWVGKSLMQRITWGRNGHEGVRLLLGRLVQTTVVVLGFLISFSVVAPSFRAGDLIKMLGIGSVAIGFAFQSILQNFLAGILLLIHQPFLPGDFTASPASKGRSTTCKHARRSFARRKDGKS